MENPKMNMSCVVLLRMGSMCVGGGWMSIFSFKLHEFSFVGDKNYCSQLGSAAEILDGITVNEYSALFKFSFNFNILFQKTLWELVFFLLSLSLPPVGWIFAIPVYIIRG